MFEDWNGDGKIDSADEFLDYQIANDSLGSGKNTSSSPGGIGCALLMVIATIFMGLLDLFLS